MQVEESFTILCSIVSFKNTVPTLQHWM